tara:strand:- start:349 stop:522 length:174 start_codon:yes stop_codon:yes gene_type:complete
MPCDFAQFYFILYLPLCAFYFMPCVFLFVKRFKFGFVVLNMTEFYGYTALSVIHKAV